MLRRNGLLKVMSLRFLGVVLTGCLRGQKLLGRLEERVISMSVKLATASSEDAKSRSTTLSLLSYLKTGGMALIVLLSGSFAVAKGYKYYVNPATKIRQLEKMPIGEKHEKP